MNQEQTARLARLSQISLRIATGNVTPAEIDEGRKIAAEQGGISLTRFDRLVGRAGFRSPRTNPIPVKKSIAPVRILINRRFITIRDGGVWQCRDMFYDLSVTTVNQSHAKQLAVFARNYVRKHSDINFTQFPQNLDEPLVPFKPSAGDDLG